MGCFCIYASTLLGIEAHPVRVEADISSGLPRFSLVGLPDLATSEARERVRSAIKNSGFTYPRTVITVNLAPAHVKKHGSSFDLAIAVSILAAQGEISEESAANILFLSELALDGSLRPVQGVLPSVIMAKQQGLSAVILPKENAEEASLVDNVTLFSPPSLRELVTALQKRELKTYRVERQDAKTVRENDNHSYGDFADIRGQFQAKRALEIAASGGHNVLFSGAPGSGKTLLARAFPSILPQPSFEESLEITTIHSVAGKLKSEGNVLLGRPFRSPHHSASGAALIGGGKEPKPGEVSLAHRGVLFLDELPEFHRQALEHLREPLEEGSVTVSRASGSVTFPSQFTLLAAMNPCPCGYLYDQERSCVCSPKVIAKYQQKISGPLLDRIDLIVEVPRLPLSLFQEAQTETSAEIKERVQNARRFAHARYGRTYTNAELTGKEIQKYCVLKREDAAFLSTSAEALKLSARGYVRLVKVARTIADLSMSQTIERKHLMEALQYRTNLSTSSRRGS